MIQFFQRDDIQTKMIGLIAVNCAIISYQCWKRSGRYEEIIKKIEKAPIYQFEQFMELQKKKNLESNKIMNTPMQPQQRKDEFYLVKMLPRSKPFLENQQKIYSNQLAFCPPSVNPALKQTLKAYHKAINISPISYRTLKYNRYAIFQGKILTDKISSNSIFNPEPKFKVNIDQNFILVFWQFLYWLGLNGFERLAYFTQKILEKLNIRKKYKRSYDSERAPLIKGILVGLLTTQFSFLSDCKFLLKVNIEGSQFTPELIADNKLMLIEYYSGLIKKQNRYLFLAATLSVLGFGYLYFKFKPWIEIYWRNWTKNQFKQLNPSGLSDDKLCQICYINCRNVIFFKCRHLIVCEECYWHMDQSKCMMCSERLQQKKVIFPLSK